VQGEEKQCESRKNKWLWESNWKGYQKTKWKRLLKESERELDSNLEGGWKKGRGAVCILMMNILSLNLRWRHSQCSECSLRLRGKTCIWLFTFSLLDCVPCFFLCLSSAFSSAVVLCSLFCELWY